MHPKDDPDAIHGSIRLRAYLTNSIGTRLDSLCNDLYRDRLCRIERIGNLPCVIGDLHQHLVAV